MELITFVTDIAKLSLTLITKTNITGKNKMSVFKNKLRIK